MVSSNLEVSLSFEFSRHDGFSIQDMYVSVTWETLNYSPEASGNLELHQKININKALFF